MIPYTSIPHDLDPKAIDYFLSNFPNGLHPQFRKPFAIEATDFLLKNINFLLKLLPTNSRDSNGIIFVLTYSTLTMIHHKQKVYSII